MAKKKKIVTVKPTLKTRTAPKKVSQVVSKKSLFPIVAIGASAGGLEALKELFKHLPINTGMSYVIIQHLDPSHQSLSAGILSRATDMPVVEIVDGVKVEPNHIYVIPPNCNLGLSLGRLKILPRANNRGQNLPLNFFFRILAEERKSQAIGVVLSGTATDGTEGLQAIKFEGGITFAQTPESAKYDGMPRSAIASGAVDFISTPQGIATELASMAKHPYLSEKLSEKDKPAYKKDQSVEKIFALLKASSHTDFSHYKKNTFFRRITRRMLLQKIDELDNYVSFLEAHPEEVKALFAEILIHVTSFFRDPKVFEVVKTQILPKYMKTHDPALTFRIWVPGCSTGEEVYSLAMTFMEFQDKLKSKVRTPLAIFGTDISESALQKARAAIYPDSITSEISPERIKKFFEKVPSGGYRIAKWLREMCLFSKHDVTRDPPFGKVDMISCRNVLIYFDLSLHKFVFPIFHYSLNPGGILLLGKSESVGGFSTLFSVADKTNKAYFKKNIKAPLRVKFPTGPYSVENLSVAQPRSPLLPSRFDLQHESERLALLEYAPPSVLVNNTLEIVQSRGRTAPYLELAPGQPSLNLLKMSHPELIADLRAAVAAAKKKNATVTKTGVRFRDSGKMKSLSIKVIPILASANSKERYFNIFFEEAKDQAVALKSAKGVSSKKDKHHQELQKKLAENEEYQQSLVEEYETAQEELVASNEELQSTNEELQSTNEELETAKEELQSANEELTTINDELQNRNSEMVGLNNDLTNLLGSVDIPIVMVGSDGRIRRFTPKAAKALKLIASDVGRLIGDIKPNIKVPDLDVLVAEVMEDMTTKEIETQDNLGRWYQLQVRPYRTAENKIDGAVISLIDIDSLKRSRDDATSIIESQPVPILVVDANYRVKLANDIFYQKFHVSKIETEGMKVSDLGSGQWKIPQLQKLLDMTLVNDEKFEHFQVEYDFPSIGKRIMFLSSRRFHLAGSGETAALLVIEDVTEQMQMQQDRLDVFLKEQKANRIKDEFLAILSHELRTPLTTILAWSQMLLKGTLDAEKTKRAIEVVEQSAKAQGQLIDDLLDISRIQAGKLHLSIQEIDPSKVLADAIESTRILAAKKSIQIETHIDPSLKTILADPIRLQQILWNLIMNSIKFSSLGGKIWVRIDSTDVEKNEWIRIQVRDNGKGIKSDFLPHLFERFTQVDSSSTRSYGGLGLGLAIVKKLVEMHGGSILAESQGEDQGSTFTALIPAKKMISDRIISNQSETFDVDERCLQNLKILVVEDDPNSREVFTIMLLSFGAIVKSAGSATEGLELFKEFRPDVLVSDIAMPGEDGYSLITKIRAQNSKIPALALTAHASQEDVQRALKAGFNAHLAKPVGANKLAFSVSRIVEQG